MTISGANRTITTSAGTLTLGGAVGDSGQGNKLTKAGAGALALNAAGTYSGGTDITGGTLQVGHDSALGSGTLTFAGGALSAGGGGRVLANAVVVTAGNGTITGSNPVTFSAATTGTGGSRTLTVNNSATTTLGNVFLSNDNTTSGRVFTINGSGSVAVNGAIANNNAGNTQAAGFTYSGSGVATLNSANTFTGATTVSAGTLKATTAGALGTTSAIAVNASGTLLLTGAGTADRINNTAGITLGGGTFGIAAGSFEGAAATVSGGSPTGTSSFGLGALTLSSNSTLDFDSLGSGTLMVFGGFNAGTSLTLNITGYSNLNYNGVQNSGLSTDDRLVFNRALTTGELAAINFGSGFTTTQMQLDSNFYEIGFTPVPEAATFAGACLMLGFAGMHRRRERLG